MGLELSAKVHVRRTRERALTCDRLRYASAVSDGEKQFVSALLIGSAYAACAFAMPLFFLLGLAEAFDEGRTNIGSYITLTFPFALPGLLAFAALRVAPDRNPGVRRVVIATSSVVSIAALAFLVWDENFTREVPQPPNVPDTSYSGSPEATLVEAFRGASPGTLRSVRLLVENPSSFQPVVMDTGDIHARLSCGETSWRFHEHPGRVRIEPLKTLTVTLTNAFLDQGTIDPREDCIVIVWWDSIAARGGRPFEWHGYFAPKGKVPLLVEPQDAGADAGAH